jgi:hypothetical protein
MKLISWLNAAINELDNAADYGATYSKLKMEFYSWHSPYIFSTRLTDFREIRDRIKNNIPLKAEPRETLGEYDKNFNDWLKTP